MDERQRWLIKQPTFWLGVAVAIAATGIAAGLFAPLVARYAAAFIAVCGIYGVGAGHLKSPPRVDLIDMSAADRETIFKAHPEVRQRFYLQHPEMAPLIERGDPPAVPPPLPPPPDK